MNVHTTEDAIACLRSVGVPITQQRIEIARVLFARPVHLSADQVLERVRVNAPETSRATVYNTLRLFREKNLLRELIIDPDRVVFDSNTDPHYHLYDVDTGEVSDVAADELKVVGVPRLPEGVELEHLDVIIRVRSKRA
ncbi:Fur family transcriptional regulator [Thauera sp.]|uniref:Fur family transcriptional regulator n=1 Tax=Thauera sp. TaxID=1905334 RepID=UPI0039E4D088